MYDIAIIGAGIAGLTAAIYGRRANKKVLVLEAKVYGGQIINTLEISNWPGEFRISGADLMKKIYEQTKELDAEIEFDEILEIVDNGDYKRIMGEESEYKAKTVIIATGSEDKKIGIKREDELVGRGVSYCATCDGALYKDKNVAIIGGGNTALYDALYLSNIAKKIYLVHRRNEFRGDAVLVEKVRKKGNVEFVLERYPVEILGDKKVEGLKLDNEKVLDVDGIFVAVGKKPATDKFAKLVKLDEKGYIEAGEDCKTSCDGVFVAGDCRAKNLRQLVTAASDGAVSASEAVTYLNH